MGDPITLTKSKNIEGVILDQIRRNSELDN
jgi:hypothetical protein